MATSSPGLCGDSIPPESPGLRATNDEMKEIMERSSKKERRDSRHNWTVDAKGGIGVRCPVAAAQPNQS